MHNTFFSLKGGASEVNAQNNLLMHETHAGFLLTYLLTVPWLYLYLYTSISGTEFAKSVGFSWLGRLI